MRICALWKAIGVWRASAHSVRWHVALLGVCVALGQTQFLVPVHAASANVLFADGFDSGNTAAWSGSTQTGSNSAVTVNSSAAFAGSFGLDTTKMGTNDNGRAEVSKTVSQPASRVLSVRSMLQVVSITGGGGLYLQRVFRSSPIYKELAALHRGGTTYNLHLRRVDGSEVDAPLGTQFVAGTWYDVELTYDWSGPQPIATLYVNGVVSAAVTDTTQGTLYAPDAIYLGLFEDGWTQQAEARWDSVSVADGVQSSGSAATSTATPTRTSTSTPTPLASNTPTPIASNSPSATPTSPPSSTGNGWNQDQHDPQHTGATLEEPQEPWSLQWIWNGSDANGGTGGHAYNAPLEARTVTGAGNVFVPAGTLGLYALSEATGQVIWHLTSPTFNATPAFDPVTGALFAGGADGNLYKISPASGAVLARYTAGSALNKSVLIVGDSVYLVASNGQLHRVRAATMTAAWVYTPSLAAVPSPIPGTGSGSTPPAYSPSRDLIVFATADLFVHGVNNSDGSLKWHTKPTPVQPGLTSENPLAGNTFEKGWPVVAEGHGLVLLRLQLNISKAQDYPSGSGNIYPTTNSAVRNYLAANPDHQNLFALALDTGAQVFSPAVGVGYTEGYANGTVIADLGSVPVVKVWPNGDEVVYVHFRNGQSSPPDWRWDSHLGEMVLDNTTVSGLSAGDLRFTQFSRNNGRVGYSGGAGYTFITDEQEPLSIAGASLFHAHWGASESAQITDRSPSLGLSYASPIAMQRHPAVIRGQQACNDFHPDTHYTTCGLTLFNDGRFWDGPGFWEYWNITAPPGSPNPNGFSGGIDPAYTYVADGLIVVEGLGGELYIFKHAGNGSTATPTPTAAASNTPTRTPTSSATTTPTSTATPAPSNTPTSAPTSTSTAVPSNTPTSAPTSTSTAVPSNTPTSAPTGTATLAPSNTPTSVPTSTATPLPRSTATAAATATATPTTVAAGGCPCSIFTTNATPTTPANADTQAVELGVKFQADVAGSISGIRFYKGTLNIGTHIGSLWTNTGTLLASATFSGETMSGWQQVSFATPVAISPNTTYVASYHTDVGHYSVDRAYFASSSVDNPPLHAMQSGSSGGNGVYMYGAGAFPVNTYNATNYWVDVVFASPSSPTSTPVATPTSSATPTAAPTQTSTATLTPQPTNTARPTNTPIAGGLLIGNAVLNQTSVSAYDKLEGTFSISGGQATNMQFPYDPAPPPGLAGRVGITVEALFLPPGQSDWSGALHQSAFLYQDYQRQQISGKDWIMPQGGATWKVRFAPTQQGTWQYVIRAQDASVCPAGLSPCPNWVQTSPGTFSVSAPRASNHGFMRVSPLDHRYFAFDDGTPFIAQGLNDNLGGDTFGTDARLATYAANGLTLVRSWMSSSTIAGTAWSPWAVFGGSTYGGYLPDPGIVATPNEPGHDFVFDLNQARTCIFNGWTRGPIPTRPNTTYQISATVKAFNMTPADASRPYGFTLKTGTWPLSCPAGLASQPNLVTHTTNTNGWTTVTGNFTTGSTQSFLDLLFMEIDNTATGEAYVSNVSLRPVQSDGSLGPDVLSKSNSDGHMDFDQRASFVWDHVIDQAALTGVSLKLVVLEKNDRVWNEINADGSLTSTDNNNNFYAAPNTKVRRLHEYYWRYLAARWAYSTAIHSWELLNEGDPYNGNHYAQADAFAQEMHAFENSRHLVSTSTWAGFPAAEFWGNPQYPNIDYADVHAYVSTGFGAYSWDPPSGTALETDPTATYQSSAGALRIPAGVTSGQKSIPIRGQGTWTVQAVVRASGVSGSCPFGASPSLAGPQVDVLVTGGPHRVIPYDPTKPDQYWICTAPAGTYDYTLVQGNFTLGDASWHSLVLSFKTSYATSGTVWYDNVVIRSPDGRAARLFGDNTFDDHERTDYDTGLFNAVYGLLDGAGSVSGAGKPVIRGETGIDYPGGPQQEQTAVRSDAHGVWLHNLLWGALNAGGMSDLYWWTDSIVANNLYAQYKPVRDFLSGIPFANGLFQDAAPIVSNANVHATGLTDRTDARGYVWIWNKNHTWFNVVNNVAWGALQGTVRVPNLPPGRAYAVSLWEFDTNGALTRATTPLTTDSSGVLTFDLSMLPASITDLALEFH